MTGLSWCYKLHLFSNFSALKLPEKLTLDHIRQLNKALSPLAYKWDMLGIQLHVPPHDLREFEKYSTADESQRRLRDTFELWITAHHPKLEDLAKVLEGPTVRQRALAVELRDNYKGLYYSTTAACAIKLMSIIKEFFSKQGTSL